MAKKAKGKARPKGGQFVQANQGAFQTTELALLFN
jgi:hypothetical protein